MYPLKTYQPVVDLRGSVNPTRHICHTDRGAAGSYTYRELQKQIDLLKVQVVQLQKALQLQAQNARLTYTHTQFDLSTEWVINHNLLKESVEVAVYDQNQTQVLCDIIFISSSTLKLEFTTPTKGLAYIN